MNDITYAVFILTHGRPELQHTYKSLRKHGYDGPVYFVIDNLDETAEEHKRLYGESVVVFDKKEWQKKTDTMDIDSRLDVVVYARNAVFQIAKDLGYRYFVVLDDDYKNYEHRYEEGNKLKTITPKDVGKAFEASFKFLIDSGILCYCWEQGGDFIGGANGRFKKRCVRKIMNTYFFDAEKPVVFKGTINEDMVASLYHGLLGDVIISSCDMSIQQMQTQKQSGGLTDAYLHYGTYVKSFYAVMMNPSCVKVAAMGDPKSGHYRMHHRVRYDLSCPVIISDRYKKKRGD